MTKTTTKTTTRGNLRSRFDIAAIPRWPMPAVLWYPWDSWHGPADAQWCLVALIKWEAEQLLSAAEGRNRFRSNFRPTVLKKYGKFDIDKMTARRHGEVLYRYILKAKDISIEENRPVRLYFDSITGEPSLGGIDDPVLHQDNPIKWVSSFYPVDYQPKSWTNGTIGGSPSRISLR